MLHAGQETLAFARGHERNDLYQDRMLLLALMKCIEIIGAKLQVLYLMDLDG